MEEKISENCRELEDRYAELKRQVSYLKATIEINKQKLSTTQESRFGGYDKIDDTKEYLFNFLMVELEKIEL